MNKRSTRTLRLVVTCLSLLVLCGCLTRKPIDSPISFSDQAIKIQDYDLFDMGVVDADDDGILDIFTSNHIAIQSLLIGDGRGNFRDVYAEWGLSHQPEFPGLEDSLISPGFDEEGVYIYWNKRQLNIRASLRDNAFDISGRLILDSPVEIVNQMNWDCQLKQDTIAHGLTRTRIDFRLDSGHQDGLLILKPDLLAVPQTFSLGTAVPLSRIFIGAQKMHPPGHAFRLSLKDRHGMVWADWNGDGQTDLFISSGGVSGNIGYFPEIYPYELFLRKGPGLVDVTSRENLLKSDCRARQVAWVDIDGDNLLDLFVYGIWSRNQLFKQMPDGQFLDVTAKSGLLDTENGLSVWFDADGDRDPDLFIAGRDAFVLYLNQDGYFREILLGKNPHAIQDAPPEYRLFGHPSLADFDGDGDVDIYVASAWGSTMLINSGGTFELKDPALFGLPSRAVTASWVDVDNDSFPDLFTIPDGLFRQSGEHGFTETRILACDRAETIVAARCNWFDADNDGDRDVLISVLNQKEEDTRVWSSRFLKNNGSDNHWLEIQVVGPPGNRNAIGASVVGELNDGRRLTQQVGISEGSYYSQGHYRPYFGLGRDGHPKSVSILWPDGVREYVEKPESDRLLICGGRRH